MILGIGTDRQALSAKGDEASCRTLWNHEVAGLVCKLVLLWLDEAWHKCKPVHRRSNLAFLESGQALGEVEGFSSRRTELLEANPEVERLDGSRTIVGEVSTECPEDLIEAHGRAIHFLGVEEGGSVEVLVRSGEEFSNLLEVFPCFRDGEFLAVFGLEGSLFSSIFKEVFTVGEADSICHTRDSIELAIVFAVVLKCGWFDVSDRDFGLGPFCQVDIVAIGCAFAEPLGVSYDHVKAAVLSGPCRVDFGFEVGPGNLLDFNFGSGFFGVVSCELLQIVCWLPFGPRDDDLFASACTGIAASSLCTVVTSSK